LTRVARDLHRHQQKTEGQTLVESLTAERFFLLSSFTLHHMAAHFLDHIDLRVSDLAEARKFYDGWLPAAKSESMPNTALQPTAGRRVRSFDLTKRFCVLATLDPAGGG
jgi:catechol-2,3-dioxygenase